MKPRGLVYTTVALVSLSALLFELIQTRILSYIFWNHIVYLTISLALLGFGISGTVVSWLIRKKQDDYSVLISVLLGAMSVSLTFSVIFVKVFLPVVRDSMPSLHLILCYIVSVPPFIFAGAVLSLVFTTSRQEIGRLYRTDLLSAGCGCVLFFVLLPQLGAIADVALLAIVMAALSWAWSSNLYRSTKHWLLGSGVAAVVLFAIAVERPAWIDVIPEPYKEMAEMRQSGAVTETTQWTTLSRIDITGSDRVRLANYKEYPIGSYKVLTQDGTANTSLPGKEAIALVSARVKAGEQPHPAVAPYAILKNPDVAIIGVGGGIDVVDALSHDARSVFGIELNPFTYHITKDLYADWNGGLLHDPRVTVINSEGRSAIRTSDKKFDLLQVIAIDTFAALNSGAYVLSENYLYTTDAFSDYFAHLKPNGLLTMYRWNSTPPKETLRLTVLAQEAWKKQGIKRFDDRVMVLGDPEWAMTIFKNGSFTPEEVTAITKVAGQLHETIFYFPKVMPAAQQHAFENSYYENVRSVGELRIGKAFQDCMIAYAAGKEKQFFEQYPFKVTPTTDDSPFFFESSSLFKSDTWNLNSLRGGGVQTTLLQIAIMSTFVMGCAIFVPLWIHERQGLSVQGAVPFTTYFAALGFGFMLIEISLMQKCVLLLGNPMYSIPVLLASILLSAGLGSGVVPVWKGGMRAKVRVATLLLLVGTAAASAFLTYSATALLRYSLIIRASACALAVVPVGFALGLFFPVGLQQIRDRTPEFVPWAWGINGCASVYGSVLAIVAAMWHGFNSVLLIGLVIYLVALASAELAPLEVAESIDSVEVPAFAAATSD